MKTQLLLLTLMAFSPILAPSRAWADDLTGPYVYKSSVRLNTQHYLVYWASPGAKEPQYLTGSWAPRLEFNSLRSR